MLKHILATTLIITGLNLKAQTGISVSELSHCDAMMQSFLSTHNIPGASFAVAKNGKLIYNRAFGKANLAGNENTQPHHRFRIASISKPVTAIAVMLLVEKGLVQLNNKVFGSGGLLENHPRFSAANISDNRIYDITVQHLLEHSAGWDRNQNCFPNPTSPYPYFFSGCDPIVAPLHVAQTLGVSNPVNEEDMITFLLEKGLDFTPNTRYAYSNIGYLVLGEVIEQVTGLPYETYLQRAVIEPAGICDMTLGNNLLKDKLEREVEYFGNGFTNLSSYGTGNYVPWEYGGFNIEAMSAHGGWIASARDLIQLLVAVDGFPSKPDLLSTSTIFQMKMPSANNSNYAKGWSVNASNTWWHTGALDGTATFFARTNGQYTWAVLLNKRVVGANANSFWNDFDNLPWNCIGQISNIPAHDFIDLPTQSSQSIQFENITDNSVQMQWIKGDGTRRMVIAKQGGAIENFPLEGQDYIANADFGAGDNLGNNTFVVYNGTGESVTINNLSENTGYSFRVIEYNQSANTGNNALYRLCGPEKQVKTSSVSGINEASIASFKLFPSPAQNHIVVECSHETQNTDYRIVDVRGKILNSGKLDGIKSTLSIYDLPAGLYVFSIKDQGGYWISQRFSKQ